jgi:hypothetical protein
MVLSKLKMVFLADAVLVSRYRGWRLPVVKPFAITLKTNIIPGHCWVCVMWFTDTNFYFLGRIKHNKAPHPAGIRPVHDPRLSRCGVGNGWKGATPV